MDFVAADVCEGSQDRGVANFRYGPAASYAPLAANGEQAASVARAPPAA
jgi:hypothetical protein